MSITIFTGLSTQHKQARIIELLHAQEDSYEGLSAQTAFIFPQAGIGKEFSHLFAHDLTFNDAAYSFNRWFEKLWEQRGTSQAILTNDQREVLFNEAVELTLAQRGGVGLQGQYINFPGIKRILLDILTKLGQGVCDPRIAQQVVHRVGEEAYAALKKYFELLQEKHFIEHVDAMGIIAQLRPKLRERIVLDGFNDFSQSQLSLLESLSINNTVYISLNYAQGNSLSSPLAHFISRLQNNSSAVVIPIESFDADNLTHLDRWKQASDFSDESVNSVALKEKALSLSLGIGRYGEIVALGQAVEDALKNFEPSEITIAVHNAAGIVDELRNYFSSRNLALSLDLVKPFKESLFGGALIELLCTDKRCSDVLFPTKNYEFQSSAYASAVFHSVIGGSLPEDFWALDVKTRKSKGDFTEACRSAHQNARMVLAEDQTLLSLMWSALKSRAPKDFKKLFDAALSFALAHPCLDEFGRKEVALAHHEAVASLTLCIEEEGESEKGKERVNVDQLLKKLIGARLMFTHSQGGSEILLTDANRVRGHKVSCLIWGGLNAENFAQIETGNISEELGNILAGVSDSSTGHFSLSAADKANLLVNEVIAAAQDRLVLVGQYATEKGEQKSLASFFETIINSLGVPDGARNVGFENEEISDALARYKAQGVTVIDALDADVFIQQVTTGGRVAGVAHSSVKSLVQPERGQHKLMLYAGGNETFEKHEFSPSALEAYARCPYNWFLGRYVSHKTIDRDLGPRELGSCVHDLLEEFYKEWNKEHGRERVTTDNFKQADELFDTVIETLTNGKWDWFAKSENPANKEFMVKIISKARSRILADMNILANGETVFAPTFFELRMGKGRVGDTDTENNMQAHVGNMKISGSIDRVDENERGDYFVIDYKGSLAHYPASNKWVEKAILQAGLYWLALENATGRSVAGATFSSYEIGNRERYLIDLDLIDEDLIRAPRGNKQKISAHDVLKDIAEIAEDSAHLMFDGNVKVAQDFSLNGFMLKDTEKNCSYCLYSDCPVRRGAQKEEGDN